MKYYEVTWTSKYWFEDDVDDSEMANIVSTELVDSTSYDLGKQLVFTKLTKKEAHE
jgi:hypothetical protein